MNRRILSFILAMGFCVSMCACSSAQAASSDAEPESQPESIVLTEQQPASEVEDAASETASASEKVEEPEEPLEEENSASLTAEEEKAAREKFQTVFDQLQIRELYTGQYDGCTRYTVVSDYDGDGRLEAFGFVGIPSDWQPAPYWENISIYYISSDYAVTALAGGDSGYDTLNGTILCPESSYADNFSNCVYTSGKEHFLAWNVAYWEGDWFGMILGVHDGKPEVSYLSSIFYVNDNGRFATFDSNDNELLLQLKDGKMVNA